MINFRNYLNKKKLKRFLIEIISLYLNYWKDFLCLILFFLLYERWESFINFIFYTTNYIFTWIFEINFIKNYPFEKPNLSIIKGYFVNKEHFSFLLPLLCLPFIIRGLREIKIKIENLLFNFLKKENEFEYNDNPKLEEEHDFLERAPLVTKLYESLNLNYESTFTILIDGKWGEGKTTVINFLQNRFKDNRKIIFFRFNPWSYSNSKKSLQVAFFEELSKEAGLPKNIIKKLLWNLAKEKIGFLRPIFQEKSLQGIKDTLYKKLCFKDKKLVIVIDDIDRLRKNDILEVFKIIGEFKGSESIPTNIVFLLLFDRKIVQQRLAKEFGKDKDYLGKVVNWFIVLRTSRHKIKEYLVKEIEKIIKTKSTLIDLISEKNSFFSRHFQIAFVQDTWEFKTLREAKAFLDNFGSSYGVLGGEVNDIDLYYLVLLQTFYPKIYNDIFHYRDLYLSKLFFNTETSSQTDDSLKEKIRIHINKLLDKEDLVDRREATLAILETMFPAVKWVFSGNNYYEEEGDVKKKKRIRHPDYFTRFFFEKLPEGVLTDSVAERMIRGWDTLSEKLKIGLFHPKANIMLNEGSFIDFFRVNTDLISTSHREQFIKECYEFLAQKQTIKSELIDNFNDCSLIIYTIQDSIYNGSFDNPDIQAKKVDSFKSVIKGAKEILFSIVYVYIYKNKMGYNEKNHKDVYKDLKETLKDRIIKSISASPNFLETNKITFVEFYRYINSIFLGKELGDILKILFMQEQKNVISFLRMYTEMFSADDDSRKKEFVNFLEGNVGKEYIIKLCKKIDSKIDPEGLSGQFVDYIS